MPNQVCKTLRALDTAVKITKKYNVPDAAAYETLRDNMVQTLLANRTGIASFEIASDVAIAAPSSAVAQAARTAAHASIDAEIDKLGFAGLYGKAVATSLRRYYGFGKEQPVARKELTYTVALDGTNCAAAVNGLQSVLTSAATPPATVAVTLKLDVCRTANNVSSSTKQFEYKQDIQTTKQVSHEVEVPVYELWSGQQCDCSRAPGTTEWRCTTPNCSGSQIRGVQTVTRTEDVVVKETVTRQEDVTVETRTTTAELRGTYTITIGSTTIEGVVQETGQASSESYRARKANKSSSFRPTDDDALKWAGSSAGQTISRAAGKAAGQNRIAEIEAALRLATGPSKLALLAEWSHLSERGHPDLVNVVTSNSAMLAADVEAALSGRVWHSKTTFAPEDLDVALPASSVSGTSGLAAEESQIVDRRRTATAQTTLSGLLVNHGDGYKYGAGLASRVHFVSGRFAYKAVVPFWLIDTSVDIAGFGSASGGLSIGYSAFAGVGVFTGTRQTNVGLHAVGGIDGLWVRGHSDLTTPSEIYVPSAWGYGYGAHIRIANRVELRATRIMRNDDVTPERWQGELLIRNKSSFGIRAVSYEELLGSSPSATRGTWQFMLVYGQSEALFGK